MPRKRGETTGGEGAAGGPLPPQPDGTTPAVPAVEEILKASGAPPQTLPDGSLNLARLQWEYQQIVDVQMLAALGKKELPRGWNTSQALDLLDNRARTVYKIDPKNLKDVRSEREKIADAIRSLANPDSSLSVKEEVLDGVIEEMERQMDAADNFGKAMLGGANGEDSQERQLARLTEAKKKWAVRLRRVKTLRRRAREEFPGGFRGNARCLAAMHPLRFMVYVGRNPDGDGRTAVFKVYEHLAVMACEAYFLDTSMIYDSPGIGATDNPSLRWIEREVDGLMLVCPPGHFKTTFAAHRQVLRTCQRPKRRVVVLHANVDEAGKNVQYVSSYFDPTEAVGQRVRALFPNLPPIKAKNTTTLKFDLPETQRSPAFLAYGINAQASGADADEIWEDDACDQKLSEQETERRRAFDRLVGTWEKRKRGMKAKSFITTTLWHHDDPNMKRIKLAKANKLRLSVKIQRCGGANTNPKFKPLCPELCSTAFLMREYAKGTRLYSACYEANPEAEELRKVKRLAYYDPKSPEHARFMETALFHNSLDPTATNREKSDKAAFVYAGIGDIVQKGDSATSYTRRLRVLDFHEFHATQTEGVNEVCLYAAAHTTHYIHVEVRSGFNASAEMFEARGLDVICHDPKNRKKELRLMDVATMLDDSLRDKGFPGAVIEFPGMRLEDGSIGPDPESPTAPLEEQILQFGSVKDDHGVDALTQLAKHLGPELDVGEGPMTKKAQAAVRTGSDPHLARMYRMFGAPPDQRISAGQEEENWMAGAREDDGS